MNEQKKLGFSLVELMIVMVIISVLALIGVPIYTKYINRGYISEVFAAVKQDQSNIVAFVSSNKFPTNETTANNMITAIGGLVVCDSKYVSTAVGDCVFGPYGIRVVTNTVLLPDVRINFTPEVTNKIINWTCSYESDSSEDGRDLLPSTCLKITNSDNVTPLWE